VARSSVPIVKPPDPDPGIEPFRDGVGVLTRNGELAGHVATSVSEFWSPSRLRRRQWCVWLIVVWADGVRERSTEDYPPWTYVAEMRNGYFAWEEDGPREGRRYDFAWLPATEAHEQRERLGITAADF
jgi:hypothetical protein